MNEYGPQLKVLKKGVVGKIFTFGKWDKSGKEETRLKYLGKLTTTKGKVYKLMNSQWFWGLAHRASSSILIFDGQNHPVGIYGLTMTFDVPDKLENGMLIFTNSDNPECDSKLVTCIDLRKGLPTQIFIKCKGDEGDLYSFSAEDK